MSTLYRIYFTLDGQKDAASARAILQRGAQKGAQYYKEEFQYKVIPMDKELTVEQAVDLVLKKEESWDDLQADLVLTLYKKAFFYLYFTVDSDTSLKLYLTLAGNDWEKEFENDAYGKDLGRYIQFLADITQDFVIWDIGLERF